jgi:hypothetical protein
MTPQLGVSLTIFILITLVMSLIFLELSIMVLENIYSAGVTHDD